MGRRETYTQHENQSTPNQAERSDDLSGRPRREVRSRRLEIEQDVGSAAGQGEPDQQIPPLLVHHGRRHASLVVRAHHHAQQEDDNSRHGVERDALGVGGVPRGVVGAQRLAQDGAVQTALETPRLEQHPAQAAAEEHHRDRHVLEIGRGPCPAGVGQVLQEDVGASVEEDHEALGEFA